MSESVLPSCSPLSLRENSLGQIYSLWEAAPTRRPKSPIPVCPGLLRPVWPCVAACSTSQLPRPTTIGVSISPPSATTPPPPLLLLPLVATCSRTCHRHSACTHSDTDTIHDSEESASAELGPNCGTRASEKVAMRRLSCHIGADPSQTVPSCAMCVALATGAMPSQSEQVSVGQLGQARRHVLPQARPSRRIAIRFVENETKSRLYAACIAAVSEE